VRSQGATPAPELPTVEERPPVQKPSGGEAIPAPLPETGPVLTEHFKSVLVPLEILRAYPELRLFGSNFQLTSGSDSITPEGLAAVRIMGTLELSKERMSQQDKRTIAEVDKRFREESKTVPGPEILKWLLPIYQGLRKNLLALLSPEARLSLLPEISGDGPLLKGKELSQKLAGHFFSKKLSGGLLEGWFKQLDELIKIYRSNAEVSPEAKPKLKLDLAGRMTRFYLDNRKGILESHAHELQEVEKQDFTVATIPEFIMSRIEMVFPETKLTFVDEQLPGLVSLDEYRYLRIASVAEVVTRKDLVSLGLTKYSNAPEVFSIAYASYAWKLPKLRKSQTAVPCAVRLFI